MTLDRWVSVSIATVLAIACWLLPAPVHATPAPGALQPPAMTVARLDRDPVAAEVITGAHDDEFVPVRNAVVMEYDRAPRWWRVTVDRDVAAATEPQLVVASPHHSRIEAWLPGGYRPVTRALVGPDADLRFSTRALVFPIEGGLHAGKSIYLRVHAPAAAPMPLSIEPLDVVRTGDLAYVGWRSAILASLLLLALMAFGFWIGIGERSYAYLMVTLLAQVGFFAAYGGELRVVPAVAEAVAADPRIARLFGLVATLSSIVFIAHYLELWTRQPTAMRVLTACAVVLGGVLLATFASSAAWLGIIANVTLVCVTATVLVAAVLGCLDSHRPAWFLLFSWLPMMALVLVRVGEVFGFWAPSQWVAHALPASFVLSGLVIMIGLGDTLQQLRRDRDRASRMATFDELTGALSRAVIESRLKGCVADAQRTGEPLSVIFFDVDRFKRINDDFGHRMGDGCLRVIVLRTRNRLRTYDLFGRWGGDEILVVLPDTRLDEALGVAENLRSAVNSRPLSIDGQLLDATLSLGVAELVDGESAGELLERADAALYASKTAGRDRVSGDRRPGAQAAPAARAT